MNWQIRLGTLALDAALPLFAGVADVSIEPQPLGSVLEGLAEQLRESTESVPTDGRRRS